MVAGLLNRSILIAFIVFLGIVVSTLTDDYRYLYLMALGLIITAALYEGDLKRNGWKFAAGFFILVLFIYLLNNFIV